MLENGRFPQLRVQLAIGLFSSTQTILVLPASVRYGKGPFPFEERHRIFTKTIHLNLHELDNQNHSFKRDCVLRHMLIVPRHLASISGTRPRSRSEEARKVRRQQAANAGWRARLDSRTRIKCRCNLSTSHPHQTHVEHPSKCRPNSPRKLLLH